MLMPLIFTFRPVGFTPMKSPLWVIVAVQRMAACDASPNTPG
jgi:hypothetical protein